MSKNLKPKIKAVLFDLGKVILHFNFDPAFKRLSKATGLSTKEIEDYFVSSGLEVLYDGGKISSREFYLQVKKALGFKIRFEAFKKIWNEIFTLNQPIVRLIEKLSKTHRLVMLSNTNQMHFEYIHRRYPILKKFDRLILSYKEKCRKPDERIYRAAAKACQARPAEIFYIDDRQDLTEAAQELDFHVFTYHRDKHSELIQQLKRLGVLSI
jgi:putative hydrolase of the HAD superfamily